MCWETSWPDSYSYDKVVFIIQLTLTEPRATILISSCQFLIKFDPEFPWSSLFDSVNAVYNVYNDIYHINQKKKPGHGAGDLVLGVVAALSGFIFCSN